MADRLPHTGMYLIVITRKRNVGSLLGHAVWKAMDFDVISYKKTVLHLSEIQVSRTVQLTMCRLHNELSATAFSYYCSMCLLSTPVQI